MTRRLGLIGAGAVAGLHADGIAAHPDARLTAVCDLDVDRARAVAPAARVFTDHRDLLASGIVDAVVINTPHGLHLPMCLDAFGAGVDVLVEKPLALDTWECTSIMHAAEAAGRLLVVGQIQHFLPEKTAVAAVLASGALGEVVAVHDQRGTDYRPGHRSAWFFDKAMSGGGALMNIGGHCLDRSLWFADSPAVEVAARLSYRFGSPVETDAALLLRLASGAPVSISVRSDQPRHVDEVTVVCEGGTLTATARVGASQRRDGVTTVLHESAPDDIPSAFRQQLAGFLAALAGEAPQVSAEHARHVVEVITTAYRAAEAGRPLPLTPAGAGRVGADTTSPAPVTAPG